MPAHGPNAPDDSLLFQAKIIGGKYRIDEFLGRGGMSEVWRATDLNLERQVAIKVLSKLATLLGGAERLIREARAIAKVRHDSIIDVIDFGITDEGLPFMAMELLEGQDLATLLLTKGRLSVFEAVQTLLPILEGLQAAHRQMIIHRDIKPENIFLTNLDGGRVQPKLLDFGIAQLNAGSLSKLTQQGSLLGTPLYMSPEQIRGEELDGRTDLWSLCVTLYQIITGRLCFSGETIESIIEGILTMPVSYPTDVTNFDGGLFAIITKGLRKNRNERFESAAQLGKELAQWLVTRGISTDITGRSLLDSQRPLPSQPIAELLGSPSQPVQAPTPLANQSTLPSASKKQEPQSSAVQTKPFIEPEVAPPGESILDEAIFTTLKKR